MPLSIGTRLGVYEVTGLLGAGGMGEVYRATDTSLRRTVALKVLPDPVGADPDQLARFQREAEVLASLNHPNIAAVYGLERAGGSSALVMELVEGSTLADLIASAQGSRAVPGALTIARQIAEALEAAHDSGIIHRDLKPANIKVRPDGTVKVLDFGLAKVMQATRGSQDATETLPQQPQTRAGTIVGTPAYMSPEQARGEPTDKRTDVWAFGCVLYEMLTGRRMFEGATSMDIVARVLTSTPDLSALPNETPASVRRLLQRCLTPDRRERLRDIGDARLELADALASGNRDTVPALIDRGRRRPLSPVVAAATLAAVLTGTVVWFLSRETASPVAPISRFALALPSSASLQPLPIARVAVSADGARFAYGTSAGLMVRARDQLDGVLMPSVTGFFFSPDGQWIGHVDRDRSVVSKIPVTGGQPVVIAEIGAWGFATWSGADIIVTSADGLFRVSSDGGPLVTIPMETLGANEQAAFPEVLPGGRTVLVTIAPTRGNLGLSNLAAGGGARIDAVNLDSGARKTILRGGAAARYVPTGHLLYAANGRLHAVAFDLARLEVVGEPVRLSEDQGSYDFAVSAEGTLLYATGGGQPERTLVWVDRRGTQEPVGAPPRAYGYPQLSPDGRRVLLILGGATAQTDRDIWTWDLDRRILERFVVDPSDNPTATWSLDGTRVMFGSARTGPVNVFSQSADGSGSPDHLVASDLVRMPFRVAPDGRLLVSADVPGQSRDILGLSFDGPRQLTPLISGPATDLSADVSPDGRWIAYDSNESGRFEVYVRPYPNTADGRWRISTDGGRQPLWAPGGSELFYRDFTGALMAVPVKPSSTFVPGTAVKIFDGAGYVGGGSGGSAATYDIADDGRFLMIRNENTTTSSLVIVQNWFSELERLVPRSR